jgi:hypothetical protein
VKTLAASIFAASLLAGLPAASAPAQSGGNVLPLLPWHLPVLDGSGKLLPWYRPNESLGYDRVLRLGWRFLERNVPVDRKAGVKTYLAYAVFDGQSGQGTYWQHNPAFLYSSLVDSLVAWYPYSGDRHAIQVVRTMLDYQLAHGTTPARWAWPHVPFATTCAGARTYGSCLAGAPRRFYGGLETDKVGLLGLGYLLFYELTQERRYLQAALATGDALASNVRRADAEHTPWPFRVDGRTGAVLEGAEYGGAIVGPVQLLDELVRLRVGNTAGYARARGLAWGWILNQPLNPSSPAFNRWSGFYEDVPYNPASRDQVSPTLTARYLLAHETANPDSAPAARGLLRWVLASLGRGPFFGAVGIDEQRAPGKLNCCSVAGLGSDTSRWAAVNALLYAQTGDQSAREAAVRSLSYATYFARNDGRVACCGLRRYNTYWFSDGYGDYLRSFSWAMAAVPELAPRGQDHLLGSTSVVQAVTYRRRLIQYRTFDPNATETLRLSFRPTVVTADGRALPLLTEPGTEGFTVRALGRDDFFVRIVHASARTVLVAGLN